MIRPAVISLATTLAACASLPDEAAPRPIGATVIASEVGIASFYCGEFAGRPTALGPVFNPKAVTAASPMLPLGSHARVTNLANGKSEVVAITDRGPYRAGRIIDVSCRVADDLGFRQEGLTRVWVEEIRP